MLDLCGCRSTPYRLIHVVSVASCIPTRQRVFEYPERRIRTDQPCRRVSLLKNLRRAPVRKPQPTVHRVSGSIPTNRLIISTLPKAPNWNRADPSIQVEERLVVLRTPQERLPMEATGCNGTHHRGSVGLTSCSTFVAQGQGSGHLVEYLHRHALLFICTFS